ncbi:hypothetical protein D3H65_11815 [Paraflavitalea soli]|uniref:Uncharacterized protein n=1 Tax=Paraflavitalea soli TaxID=2315862 RepID=A0A3B7MNS5_9BACT|nr:hypothetical protein D3H65_11815 [Paraflavitalea soli]
MPGGHIQPLKALTDADMAKVLAACGTSQNLLQKWASILRQTAYIRSLIIQFSIYASQIPVPLCDVTLTLLITYNTLKCTVPLLPSGYHVRRKICAAQWHRTMDNDQRQ